MITPEEAISQLRVRAMLTGDDALLNDVADLIDYLHKENNFLLFRMGITPGELEKLTQPPWEKENITPQAWVEKNQASDQLDKIQEANERGKWW